MSVVAQQCQATMSKWKGVHSRLPEGILVDPVTFWWTFQAFTEIDMKRYIVLCVLAAVICFYVGQKKFDDFLG